MSKHNNANWDHYKVAGREHPGDDVHHDEERQQFSGSKAHAERASQTRPPYPNQERASQPQDGEAEGHGPAGDDASGDPQNISGTADVEPTLERRRGVYGLAATAGRLVGGSCVRRPAARRTRRATEPARKNVLCTVSGSR